MQSEPVRGRRQITSAERTNMWSVCLTRKGVLNYLNRRISPVGEPAFPLHPAVKNASAPESPSLPQKLLPRRGENGCPALECAAGL